MTRPLRIPPKRELWLVFTLAGIQFTHILDFMIMMPLGPQFKKIIISRDANNLVQNYWIAAVVGAAASLAAVFMADQLKM